jgi:trehalose 6-phosphate phosphatase
VLAEALRPVTEDPRRAGIFLDVDGTLAPIVERAEDARVPPATASLLAGLADRYACVACITGRSAEDAQRLVGVDGITYVGSHGADLLSAEELAEWAPRVHAFVQEQDTGDLRVEDKGAIVALHWRGMPEAEEVARRVADAAEAAGFATHWGRMVLEIRPPIAFDKGRVVDELMRRHDLRVALYAGDDRTDLDAFEVLVGVKVGVRSDEGPPEIVERADLVVDGPEGLVAVLQAL